jgi:hypothetical protein
MFKARGKHLVESVVARQNASGHQNHLGYPYMLSPGL